MFKNSATKKVSRNNHVSIVDIDFRDIYDMKKELFLKHQQQLVEQLKTNIKSIEAITYGDFLDASEQAIKEGHEDPEMTAFLCITHPFTTILLRS